ncbi:MAG: hypothetical protein FWJ90_15265 [Actinomadura sp.]
MDPGFRLDGRYRLERRTGRHGPAEVWRAHDELLARPVAVTLAAVPRARRDLRRRLRDAARAAAALDHPDIVTTYDFGEAEGTGGDALVYAVTEFLTGESLAARLSRGLPGAYEAVAACAQAADALAAVHACGIAHGDLSPAQVLLTEDGVKLLGLGITGAIAARNHAAPEPAETGPAETCPAEAQPAETPAEIDPGKSGPGESGPAEAGAAQTGTMEAGAAQAEDVRALGRILAACLPGSVLDGAGSGPLQPDPAGLQAVGAIARWCEGAGAGGGPAASEVAEALRARLAGMPVPAADGAAVAGSGRRWRGLRRAVLLGGAGAAVLAVVLAPLAMISASLPDGPRGIVAPPLPSRSTRAAPTPGAPGAGGRPAVPAETPGRALPPAAVPAAGAREAAVQALSRMRRAIDVGMAEGEVGPRFGTELATEVTTLMNEVDGGRPVDLDGRVERLREALAARGPGDVSPERAAGLAALLAEIPVHS